MRDELVGDVDGIDLPLLSHDRREQACEQPRAGADVGHGHTWFQLERLDDFMATIVNVAAFPFEALDELRDIWFFESLVDARLDTFLLGGERRCQCTQCDENGEGQSMHSVFFGS